MKPGGGKAKGNGFESQIAKKLTKALDPLTFIRTPGSGARLGGKNFEIFGKMFGEEATKLFTGDVAVTNEKEAGVSFRYSVECKSYKTPDNFTALVSGNANFFKWFEEAIVDAEKISKLPMLIFKWNHTPVFAAIRADDVRFELVPRFIISRENRSIAVFELDELLTHKGYWVTPL
jgi:hypothetical protein